MPTIPVIYGTALYALHDRTNLRKGEVNLPNHSEMDINNLYLRPFSSILELVHLVWLPSK